VEPVPLRLELVYGRTFLAHFADNLSVAASLQ
jgi:hypothetical protein